MTEQIENAIKTFNQLLFFGKVDLPKEEIENNIKTAIRSLNAWKEVLTELENFDVNEYLKDEGHRFGCNEGICYAMELIMQKLAEIEEK